MFLVFNPGSLIEAILVSDRSPFFWNILNFKIRWTLFIDIIIIFLIFLSDIIKSLGKLSQFI